MVLGSDSHVKIEHFILGVEATSKPELISSHLLALRSLKTAKSSILGDLRVRQHIVVTAEEFDYRNHSLDTLLLPQNARAIYGSSFLPLPFASDIFQRMAVSKADVVLVSNADICVANDFYVQVERMRQSGVTSWTAHRRTILHHSPPGGPELAWLANQVGIPHEGSDLFVTTPKIAGQMRLGKALFGMPGIGDLILVNLALFDDSFRRLRNAKFTFHVGDDRDWNQDCRSDVAESHNDALAQAALEAREAFGSKRFRQALTRAELGKFSRNRLLARHRMFWPTISPFQHVFRAKQTDTERLGK
jgi:hypothetical protein